jgi:carbon starvation protein
MATIPRPGVPWSWDTAATGGLILWPLFGATNQLLGGLAFLVIAFYLWRRRKPIWFLVLPMLFMLIMPAWAMVWQIFVEAVGSDASWIEQGNWVLVTIGLAALALEVWMVIEAIALFPQVRGVLERNTPIMPARAQHIAASRPDD